METKKKSLLEVILLSIVYYYLKANSYFITKIANHKAKRKYFKLKRNERVLLEIIMVSEKDREYYIKLFNENRKELNKYRNTSYFSEKIYSFN